MDKKNVPRQCRVVRYNIDPIIHAIYYIHYTYIHNIGIPYIYIWARDVCVFAMIRPAKCLNYLPAGFIARAHLDRCHKIYNTHGS